MRVNMVTATSKYMATRVFIGCDDMANEFGAWLQWNGWNVRIESDVDPQSQPRLFEEEAVAATLTAEFEKWKGTR